MESRNKKGVNKMLAIKEFLDDLPELIEAGLPAIVDGIVKMLKAIFHIA